DKSSPGRLFRAWLRDNICRFVSMRIDPARWISFISACIASVLALQVALALGLFAWNGEPNAIVDLSSQSREAGVAAATGIVSVIAQIIARAPRSDKRK
ncbi:MAG: hypothetical protein ACI4XG_22995, partial [Bradyrhizobium sp.]